MRLPLRPPAALPRDEMLRAAAERLGADTGARPAWIGDPADPGWLLLEEAAWSAEGALAAADPTRPERSAALATALGARQRAAVPAVGVVGLVVANPGLLEDGPEHERLQVVDSHAEERAGVVYVLVEPCPAVVGRIDVEGHDHVLHVEEHLGVARVAVGQGGARGGDISVTTPAGAAVPHARRWFDGGAERIWILTIPLAVGTGPAELRIAAPPGAAAVLNPAVVVNAPRSSVDRDVPVPVVGLGRWDLSAAQDIRWGAGRTEALVGGRGLAEALERLEGGSSGFPAWRPEKLPDLSIVAVADSLLFRREAVDTATGRVRSATDASAVRLAWVRTTCGSAGNAPAGALRFALQAPDVQVKVLDVTAPWPIDGGRDAETPAAFLGRLAAGAGPEAHGYGALPGDLEDRLRLRLADAALDWVVRVWDRQDRELLRLLAWGSLPLVSAGTGGPTVLSEERDADLIVAAGPREAAHWTAADVSRAHAVMTAWFVDARNAQDRFSTWCHLPLRRLRAVVPTAADLPLPTHGLGDLDDGDILVDAWGERRRPVPGAVLLDAVIVEREDR